MLANANDNVNDNADNEDDFRIVYLPKFGWIREWFMCVCVCTF